MAKKSNKEWRLPSNIKAFVLILIKLFMWLLAGIYFFSSLTFVIAGGGAISFIPIIFAIIVIIAGTTITQLVDKYL